MPEQSRGEDRITIKRSSAVNIGVVIAVIIIVLCAAFISSSDDGGKGSSTLYYYKNGNKVSEITVGSGTSVTVAMDAGANGDSERFVGWNTRPDMTGRTILPGTPLIMDKDISLYAMVAGLGVFAVILPDEQIGYTITAEPPMVGKGGSSILSYSIMPSHMDDDLVIAVNGNPIKLDAMKRIYLINVNEDQIVTVSGVLDKREHSISLPAKQVGYILTSSTEQLHHGQSYTLEFRLLPGYRATKDFGIHVSGGAARFPTNGVLVIEDVRDNHKITVTGVESIKFNMIAGKNIFVFVNGIASPTATVDDLVTVIPAEGYTLPATFNSQMKGDFTTEGKGYRICSDIVFPSVLRVTVGENVKIGNLDTKTTVVCSEDKIQILPVPGYALPDNYVDMAISKNGVKYLGGWFSFNNDVVLPSIYKVVYNGYIKVHETIFAIEKSAFPLPSNIPKKTGYSFDGWNMSLPSIVTSDISINSIWSPMTHKVYFGPNLIVFVENNKYTFEEGSNNPPREIMIKSNERVEIRSIFPLNTNLPDDFGPLCGLVNYVNGLYYILEDCYFPGVTIVEYAQSTHEKVVVTIGSGYTPVSEPPENKLGYLFLGWMYNDILITGQLKIENTKYLLYPCWKPIIS